jgi:hypothetical protein
LTGFAVASFLAFGALLVLFGSNGSALIAALELDYADLGLLGSCLSLGLGVGIAARGDPSTSPRAAASSRPAPCSDPTRAFAA